MRWAHQMGLCFGGGNRNNIVIVPNPSAHKMLSDKNLCWFIFMWSWKGSDSGLKNTRWDCTSEDRRWYLPLPLKTDLFWPVNNLMWDKLLGLKFASVGSWYPLGLSTRSARPGAVMTLFFFFFQALATVTLKCSARIFKVWRRKKNAKSIFRWLTTIFSCSELSNVHPGKSLLST